MYSKFKIITYYYNTAYYYRRDKKDVGTTIINFLQIFAKIKIWHSIKYKLFIKNYFNLIGSQALIVNIIKHVFFKKRMS